MRWYEIIVNTTSKGTELVADAFFSIGCVGGVKIIDHNDILDIIKNQKMWDYIDEELLKQTDIATVSGYVSFDQLFAKLDELKQIITAENVSIGEITYNEISDECWLETWKKFFQPIVADNFVVVPKWINYENKNKKIVISINPGMAFGTGEHESTKLCLKLMSEIDFADKKVIDVGCGSGILGIGAVLSGAKSCYMCDIDSLATASTKENCELNKILDKVCIELADLLCKKDIKGDVILANLTADILIRLSDGLVNHINDGGTLICSGIIHSRKQEVISAFTKSGLHTLKQIEMGDWDALKLGR